MAETVYTRTISTATLNGVVNAGILHQEIEANATITSTLVSLHPQPAQDLLTLIFDPALGAGEITALDATLAAHTGAASLEVRGDASTYTLVWNWLLNFGKKKWSEAQITAGLDTRIYPDLTELATPTAPTVPNIAIIDDGSSAIKLAYWDFSQGASGSWQLTTIPWDFPFLEPGHVIKQNTGNGTGNSAWNFAMGTEYHIEAVGRILDLTMKFGAGGTGQNHRWEIRKSTATGSTAPALNTYTDIVATGLHNYTTANTWESVALSTPIVTAVDEWYLSYVYMGGGGQSSNVTLLRNAGELLEDYATLTGGVLASAAGGFPGPNPLPAPTSRSAAAAYGISTLEMGAPA